MIERANKLVVTLHDEHIVDEVREVQNLIRERMRAGSNNLFTFAKAFPLVDSDEHGQPVPFDDYTISSFELMPKINAEFLDSNKEIQVKYD